MRGFPNSPEDSAPDAWDALHQGADRDEVDSPARFTLDRSAVLMRVRSVHGMQRRRPPEPDTRYRESDTEYSESDVQYSESDTRYAEPDVRYDENPVGYGEEAAPEEAGYPTGRHAMPPAPAVNQVAVRQRTRMRPYAHTRGRTRPDYELALETLVSTSDRGRRYQGATSVQHRRICDLCGDARSIAEIAAYLCLPLNVVKVLVSDMDNLELVVLHQPGLSFGDRSSREFMDRVLAGLRAL
ncbi:DUF742 domain-containing protein [Amycolatopsis sp. GM8]|uniref:DUF742 domain-containing protein n=1 Tax=Amycolatopsis sp. GM8 TaxID=2896530 RepID=UPI001F3205C8|nr:DUF742 domain-containing protein [Amycolatopsis sp. GM8]